MAGDTVAKVAAADEESATLLNRLLAVEKRQWDAPTNFHHASIAVCLDPSMPCIWRIGMLCGSAVIVIVQLFVIVSVWVGIGFNTCQAGTECTAGFWCKHSRARCDLCILPGLPAQPGLGLPPLSFCTAGSPLPTNVIAETWAAVLNSIPDASLHVQVSDYSSHCDSCYSSATGFSNFQDVWRVRIEGMAPQDHISLIFASIIIALCASNELRDVQLGTLISSTSDRPTGWRGALLQVALWLLGTLRRFAVLGCLPNTVCSLVSIRGADALNICLNAVAVCFVLEIDNLVYEHGTSTALREWCTEHARPSLTAADDRAVNWARITSVVGVTASIVMGLQLERWKASVEDARVAAFAVFALATMPPLLAEAAARRSARAVLSMAVGFGMGYGVFVGLVDALYKM